MRYILYITVILTTVGTTSHLSIYSDVKDNVLNFLQRSLNAVDKEPEVEYKRERKKDLLDERAAQIKTKVMEKYKKNKIDHNEPLRDHVGNAGLDRQVYRMDPVLNYLGRRKNSVKKKKRSKWTSSSASSSSSLELQEWKDEWKEHWIQKKFEAINSTGPRGDTVNMLAARPWGVPCGDPNQHDMPWGTCMLPMECEPEFRIFRGDYFCGRSQFVCCALQQTSYDMYQGFDVSFDSTSMETDSDEKLQREKGSKERRRKKKIRNKRRRQRERFRRKRKIKKDIKKIVREIKRILSRSYRNTTTMRKRKTKQLKRFVKDLKKRYKKDRKSVKNIHNLELIKIDNALGTKLQQIKAMNRNFFRNQTFRDIIVNGTASSAAMRMLVDAYPDLLQMLDNTRRSNDKNYDNVDYGGQDDRDKGFLYY